MKTPWTDLVDENCPLPEYPRPQLVRDRWLNLNGKWDYCITDKAVKRPEYFDGEIIVPFAVEERSKSRFIRITDYGTERFLRCLPSGRMTESFSISALLTGSARFMSIKSLSVLIPAVTVRSVLILPII